MGYEHIGDRIRYLRQCREITQKELAKTLFIKPNTLSQYENGKRNLTAEMVKKIAQYFNVSMDYLMGITEEIYDNNDQFIKVMVKRYTSFTEEEKLEFKNYIKMFKEEK
ncbi:helix-turn-helix transcriptional regulator [Clostridium botulinum]|uniref:helix-turn-helix domain-containing protein n=1 Tax=Clostridium botulinum TaxID=1491 RepID=UPI0009B30EA5|nr:helix-turn-helix transcriptional regulator [Clostridium botulinum]NFS28129.1 helix-turn-helix transcriptional regulator [Clostridium botulinum]NFS54169.1 helix-turn-helix transcriptional regulator [Clostridium botulinum]NFT17082.1 helix-turn-helix transcriptional regulator [Clostridium botulinum]